MSFKVHLIIVCTIIIAVFFTWHIMENMKKSQPAEIAKETASPYSITITHASWGVNCRNSYTLGTNDRKDPFAYNGNADNKLHEDNVLEAVSKLCNGKLKCSIPIKKETLGDDPAPSCGNKMLNIEYRCFSFDRPWIVEGDSKKLDIDCSTAEERNR